MEKERQMWTFVPSMSFYKGERPREFVVYRRQRPVMADIREEDKSSDLSARATAPSPNLFEESGPSRSEKRFSESEKQNYDSVREPPKEEVSTRAQHGSLWGPNVSPVQPQQIRLFVTNPDPDDSACAPTSPELVSNMECRTSRNINDDFDFSARKNSYKATRLTGIQRKLDKKKPSILYRRSSSSSSVPLITDPPQHYETSGCDESSRDVSLRLDAIFGSRVPPRSASCPTSPVLSFFSNTFTAARPATATYPTIDNPFPTTHIFSFPDDRASLEGLINIHLGKLDRYKRQVISFNLTIEHLYKDYATLVQTLAAQITPQLVTALELEIEETRAGRNSKRRYVDFHRGELRAIAGKVILLDEELGLPPSLMQIYDWMETQDVWDELFY